MKRFFVFLVVIFSLISCNQSKRIVTDIPIKTEVLGVKLCEKMTTREVRYALMDHTDKYFKTTTQRNGDVKIYSNIPTELNFNYGRNKKQKCEKNYFRSSSSCCNCCAGRRDFLSYTTPPQTSKRNLRPLPRRSRFL